MPRLDDEPAFPTPELFDEKLIGTQQGMTLREYYTGQALTQFLQLQGQAWSGKEIPRPMADQIAKNCVLMAEAVIRALDK